MNTARPIIAYALHDEAGHPIAERNADAVFYAASTIKLAVMLAVMRAVDAGGLAFDESLDCARRFASGVGSSDFVVAPEDADPEYPEEGTRLPVSQLLGMMISRSSNESTNVLVDRVGLSAVGQALVLCGATASKMERRFGDVAATDAGLTNEISPTDLVKIMRCIVTGAVTTPSSTDVMRGLLMAQQHVRIGASVADGTTWGSKSGDVPGIDHDVAFIGDVNGRGPSPVRYLAVCTRGYEPEQGREVIRSVASALLTARR